MDDSGVISVKNITNSNAADQGGYGIDNDKGIHDHGPCECETYELSVNFEVQRQSSKMVEVKREASRGR